jgi:lincosamide nucleotidyltransferase
VLLQERLITRTREVCLTDERLDAALMYGSFAIGEADAYSDVEFWLFFDPDSRDRVDRRGWCEQIAPVTHLVRNEFGTDVVFFPDLVRGEFHFATTDDIPSVRAWPAKGAATDRMIVLDRRGLLRPALDSVPEQPLVPTDFDEIETLCGRFANWLVLGHHVAARGETLRAWDALGHVHRHLTWLARLAEQSTTHWLTPSRRAEAELSPEAVTALLDTTVRADADGVRDGLRAAWKHGRQHWIQLARRHGRSVPEGLFAQLDGVLCDAGRT